MNTKKLLTRLKPHGTAAVSVLLVGVLVLGSVGFVRRISHNLWDNSTASIKSMTDVAADTLRQHLDTTRMSLVNFADTLPLIEREDVQTRLAAFTEENHFSRTAVVWSDGSGIYNDGSRAEVPGEHEDWFDFSVSPKISRAYFGWNGQRQVTMRCPIIKDGTEVGVLYGFSDLQHYYMPSAMEFYSGSGYAYMIDASDGRYLVYTGDTSLQGSYTTLFAILSASGNTTREVEDFQNLMLDHKTGSTVLSMAKEDTFLYATPVNADMNWYLVAAVPADAIQRASHSVMLLTAILCAFLVGCMVLVQAAMRRHDKDQAKIHARQERNRLFSLIANTIDNVIMIYKADTRQMDLVFQNCSRILGLDAAQVREHPERYIGNVANGELDHKLALMQTGSLTENVSALTRYRNPVSGEEQWLKLGIYPIPDSRQYILVAEDQTEEQRVKQLLQSALDSAESANQAKSMFLSNMSHDIRTPMNGIIGMTLIARQSLDDRERVDDCLKKITVSAKLLLGLINDVLDMSKIESGKLTLSHESFRLEEVTDALSAIIGPQAAQRELRFCIDLGQVDHSALIGDTLRLNQILLNLLSNAVKFTGKGGEVSLKVAELPQRNPHYAQLQFTVKDTGCGMSPETLEHLFQPFISMDKHGTGLGMPITKNLLTLMGGTIQVQSVQGEGTTFQVELPFEIDRATEQSPSSAQTPVRETEAKKQSLTGVRLLLVEDNELNKEIAWELLTAGGAECDWARNGREAVDRFQSAPAGHYDLILMDIQMPVMNGYEAARAIRSSGQTDARTIPIVAMTANTFQDDVAASREAGMDEHIGKPIDVGKLYHTIWKLLRR